MQINAIGAYQAYPVGRVQKTGNAEAVNSARHSRAIPMLHISFKGNPDKHPNQIVAYATESNYLGAIYKAGGLGDVAEALPESIGLHAKEVIGKEADIRTFYPYYTLDDPEGRIYVLRKESAEKAEKGLELTRKDDFILVDRNYKLKDGEQFALITESKNGQKVDRYFLLKETGLTGDVERMSETALEMEKVPYRIFEVDTKGERKDRIYVIHTDEHAKGKSAYGVYPLHARTAPTGTTAYGGASGAYGGARTVKTRKTNEKLMYFATPKTDDMFYTEQLRAIEQAVLEGKMDTAAHGNFNPQNLLLHDRFGYAIIPDIVQKAKDGDKNLQGLRFVEVLHNPGPFYQGRYDNPLDFFRIVATQKDLEKLQANEHYTKVKRIAEKINRNKATAEECTQLYRFFKPYFQKFLDSEQLFNMTMMAIRMTDENPQNSNVGNVSKNYGKETRNFATEDIAKSLTQALIDIKDKTIDVVNGTKPQNMGTNKKDGFFGTGSLNEIMKSKYVPFEATDSPDAILKAKTENKKTVINLIADATKNLSSDSDAVAKVFFNENKMNGIRGNAKDNKLALTLGGLSEYKEGDLLFTTWGRPDAQKGLPVTLEAFEQLLKDESIPLEIRKHCKLIMGAGGGNDAFSGNHAEWVSIKQAMERIANIEAGGEKGVFKHNACYVNGLFPNRIANCVDAAIFTSRYEPCGITPFESFATGTPVININTGGAPDFIKSGKTGYLTKDPYMLSAKALGLADDVKYEVLDKARMEHSAKQVAEAIKTYLEPLKDGSFAEKQKEFIKNCLSEKIEWHTNRAYNGGKSALELYLLDKFRTLDNDIPSEYQSDFRGEFDNDAFKPLRRNKFWSKLKEMTGSKKGLATLAFAGGVLVTALGYTGYKKGWLSPKFEDDKKPGHLSRLG